MEWDFGTAGCSNPCDVNASGGPAATAPATDACQCSSSCTPRPSYSLWPSMELPRLPAPTPACAHVQQAEHDALYTNDATDAASASIASTDRSYVRNLASPG
jgi:hypothetical protein